MIADQPSPGPEGEGIGTPSWPEAAGSPDKGTGALVKVKGSSLLWIQRFELGALGLNVLRQWIYALARDGIKSP